MPIVEVEIDLPAGQSVSNYVAQRLAGAVAEILSVETSKTWVRVRPLAASHRAGGEDPLSGQANPVFVTVRLVSPPGPWLQRDQAEALAKAIADICDRPLKDVHVLFEPSPAGPVPRREAPDDER